MDQQQGLTQASEHCVAKYTLALWINKERTAVSLLLMLISYLFICEVHELSQVATISLVGPQQHWSTTYFKIKD